MHLHHINKSFSSTLRCKRQSSCAWYGYLLQKASIPKMNTSMLKQTLCTIHIHLKSAHLHKGMKRLFIHACIQEGKYLCLSIYIWIILMYGYGTHCWFLVGVGYANLTCDIECSFKARWWWYTNYNLTIGCRDHNTKGWVLLGC